MTDLPDEPLPEEPPEDPLPEDPLRADGLVSLAYGWAKFREHFRPLLIVILLPILAELIVAIVGKAVIDSAARRFLFQVFGVLLEAVAGLGIRRMALMITAGDEPDVALAFRYDRWGAWIVFSLVFGLIESVGLVLCVIPGALFLAFFGLAPYFFLDRGMGIGDALRSSRAVTVQKGLAFPVLAAFVVGVLGVLACVVGVFLTQAVAAVALAYLYRYATDQPVAA